MFGIASTIDGELSGTIHAIDGMCFVRSGEGGMTYSTTMNNCKHDNRVNRVQHFNTMTYSTTMPRKTMKNANAKKCSQSGETD
jgi:hypothetical protein